MADIVTKKENPVAFTLLCQHWGIEHHSTVHSFTPTDDGKGYHPVFWSERKTSDSAKGRTIKEYGDA